LGEYLKKFEVLWCLQFQGQAPVMPLVPEDEHIVMLQNIKKYLLNQTKPNDIAPCPG